MNAAVNGVADDLAKRWESMVAREQRFDAKVAALTAAHEEIRTLAGVSQQASLTIKRELERLAAGPIAGTPNVSAPAPTEHDRSVQPRNLDAYKYVGFEDQFRGSQETIRERLESYLPYFDGDSRRARRRLRPRGVPRPAEGARDHRRAGSISITRWSKSAARAGSTSPKPTSSSYLAQAADGSLGGLFAAQVVEHLEPAYLLRFLELALHKLRPGAPLVLETLNPACWVAFFESFIRDITHVWPLHPETLQYLVLASGFTTARIEYRSPVPPEDRLQTVATAAGVPPSSSTRSTPTSTS